MTSPTDLRTPIHTVGRRRFWVILLVAALIGTAIHLLEVKPAVAQSPILTAWRSVDDPGLDPTSDVWDDIPPSLVQLAAQSVTPPMSQTRPRVLTVKALHHNGTLYVNLHWADSTADERTDAVGVFADAVAVQFPAVAEATVPAICMGQADEAVNIWHWRADSQAGISAIPRNGYVDLYPAVDELHYPAAAAANPMIAAAPVQNLVAGGFGTLSALDGQDIKGIGTHADTGWTVTMARSFGSPGELQPAFHTGGSMDVAFAVWNGASGDRNGQKSVSSFIRMALSENPYNAPVVPSDRSSVWPTVGALLAAVVGVAIITTLSWTSGRRHEEGAPGRSG